ncbi:hypothetical protein [Carboxylicivirga sp. RSCT41]|uniref:hypothetical protein n=1 Tax=Carboxylicivirga agarovorans TaxID=3417570 RepID=UPI003D34A3A7
MLSKLHQYNQYILLHKASQWKELQTDRTINIAYLHSECENELLNWLKQLQSGNISWKQVHANLNNLLNIKEQLEETPWNYLPPKNSQACDTFTEDLLFYMMICSLLRTACSYFQSYDTEKSRPSKVSLLPSIELQGRRFENLLKPYLDAMQWLRVIFVPDDIEYLCLYDQVADAATKLHNADAISVIKPCIARLTRPPNNHQEEMACIRCMRQMLNAITEYNERENWLSFRMLLSLSVSLSDAKSFSIDQYSHWLDSHLCESVSMEDELLFWKQNFTHYKLMNANYKHAPPTQFFDHLIKYLKKKLRNRKCSRVCSHYARYDGTPMEFARYIYLLTQRHQLEVNNSRNLKEVTRYFYDLVFVKHTKCDKRIDFETIYSYVRRYSNGELE